MTTNYPGTGIDSFPTHVTGDVIQASYDNNEQDAIVALETKVGIDGSAVSSTHDYKLSGVIGSDKAVSKTGTETLANKTLTSAIINTPDINVGSDATGDILYRNSSGHLSRLAVGSSGDVLTVAGGLPSYSAPVTVNNASTTVKGIVEIATAAEITAGTATGGTGAVLALSPDNLALSTPVFDGSGLTNIAINSISTDVLNTYQNFQLPMVGASSSTINGWTLVTVTQSVNNATMTKMSGSGSADFTAQSLLPGSGTQDSYRYDESKIIRIKFKARLDDTNDRKGFGLCITPANIHTAQTDVTNGEIRFIWNTTSLYAQNANGSTATSTDISSGITATQWNTYEIIFTPGVNAKFYVNGSLKATHTTNLPTTGTPGMTYGANANGRVVATTFPIISIQN